jgi:hypothetical protein
MFVCSSLVRRVLPTTNAVYGSHRGHLGEACFSVRRVASSVSALRAGSLSSFYLRPDLPQMGAGRVALQRLLCEEWFAVDERSTR